MLRDLFLGLIFVSAAYAVYDWRKGFYLLILVGVIQDPVRKMLPGAPGYLVLATAPIFAGVILGMLMNETRLGEGFKRSFPQLFVAMACFVVSIIPGAVISITYGQGGWKLAAIGLFSYGVFIIGLLVGYCFPKNRDDIQKLFQWYCILTGLMLIGTPLEYLGVGEGWSVLGTKVMEMEWVRTRSTGATVYMMAGFYRSPDIMGWHTSIMVMLSVIQALRTQGLYRIAWILLAGWGSVGLMLCGRRKVMFMIPIFCVVLLYFFLKSGFARRFMLNRLLGLLLSVVVLGGIIYQAVGPDESYQSYYTDTQGEVSDRVMSHGYKAVMTTFRQSGYLGAGLGSASLGAHHLNVDRPHTWQEGGMSRLAVELGLPGLLCFLVMGGLLAWILISIPVVIPLPLYELPLYAGLVALFVANSCSFIVSHQLFGDPFVATFFTFLIGLSLSAVRLPCWGKPFLVKRN